MPEVIVWGSVSEKADLSNPVASCVLEWLVVCSRVCLELFLIPVLAHHTSDSPSLMVFTPRSNNFREGRATPVMKR